MQSSNADGVNSLGRSLTGIRTDPEQMPLLEATAAAAAVAGRELGERIDDETSQLTRLAGEYHDTGRLVALLLSELGLSGEGYPLGRLVFSRFMVIQTQVRMLALRLDRLDAATESIAAAQWRDAIELRRLQLNSAELEAGPAGQEPLLRMLARRTGVTPEQLHTARDEAGGIGDAALKLLRRQVETDDARFGSDLRAMNIIMRIAFIEMQEQVIWRAK